MFDPCEHTLVQLALKAGKLIRELEGLPAEKNLTVLHEWTMERLGFPRPPQMTSKEADRMPGPPSPPSKECPRCGKLAYLSPICQGCKDAKDEHGNVAYRTAYACGCGLYFEKTDEYYSQRLSRMGLLVPEGKKEDLGIKTITDGGLK